MFTSSMSIEDSRPKIDYILSPCSLVAVGLVKMMTVCGMRPVVLTSDIQAMPVGTDIRRLVVFLPEAPGMLLITLQQAAKLLEQSAVPLPMLIISRSPANWLWHTLLHQVTNQARLSKVRAASSDLPVSSLTSLVQNYILNGYPSIKQLADEETRIDGMISGGLTKPELNAILGLLSGYRIMDLAKRCGISHKTLYAHTNAGLKKMVENHPVLASQFPGSQIKKQTGLSKTKLSAFERELVHAIHSRQIFPVFQPITDEHLQLQGVEILCRWNRNGNIILPGEFLSQVSSEYAWLVLSAFMLQEAVQNINQHPGMFYFSVNIPTAIASNENLIRMMDTACQQLHQQQMSKRLALELAENTDLNRHGKIAENIARLQKRGFRIMLDDCYSQSSVLFPIRTCRFNAYKLDMSVVNDMQHDPHALALIKSLLYYCQLTGSSCIAEGVDSLEKFNTLKALGVIRFQGYYISPPVTKENIVPIIQDLSLG